MPRPRIVRAIRRAVRSLPGWPTLRALDLSCGDGDVLEMLIGEGCPAEGTHYRQDDYIFSRPSPILKTATVHRGVDLTQPLPFPDAALDLVLATEVIEHLPTCVPLLAEVRRLLKPGGWFVFSTPNIHRLTSRVRFLLTGQHELRSARLGWHVPAEELYSTHHNPAYFPVLHTLLHQNGLHIRRLGFTECHPLALAWAPLLPVVAIATAWETRHAAKRSPTGGRDLRRWMLDPCLWFSDQLLAVAQLETSPPR